MGSETTTGERAAGPSIVGESPLHPRGSFMRNTRSGRLFFPSSQSNFILCFPHSERTCAPHFCPSIKGTFTLPPHLYQWREHRVISQFSLDRCLILIFPESKTVHSPTFNSVTQILPGRCQC